MNQGQLRIRYTDGYQLTVRNVDRVYGPRTKHSASQGELTRNF